ncbi:hypothetical protein GGS23DRAFT_552043 [Durotheca rogersii]|uniref:uncharacterized protein n=1 Tax=Durotheca rogersii TaxID=419775 RepID=UPI002221165A|nr:uncharacterized protein GGS23DRAFT_552043 [Durotheca rogersii]KAI5866779.1 hypothetical protein GGS23DRAFT_552043 [Durotheca rogersii]
MVLLTELPPEILQHVLGFVDPPDLAWIPRICKSFYHTVAGNTSLFRAVYLNNFDNPTDRSAVNWEQDLKNAVRLQIICRRENVEDKKNDLPFVYDTVTALLRNAATDTDRVKSTTHPSSLNADLLSAIFKQETNQSAFLRRSFIYERARGECSIDNQVEAARREDHQKSAHLHCLYGVPVLYAHSESHRTRRSRMSPFACSKVYDIRQYTENTMWGPFMDDDTGRVDWEKVEAIMVVIGSNLRKLGLTKFPVCRNFWEMPFAGTWPHSYKPIPIPTSHEPGPLDLQDPYGVTGMWLRVVCFLDYTDFFAYNFNSAENPPPRHIPRPAIDVGEATRLILMKLRVTKIEPPGPEDGQALPVVFFEGISRSLDNSFDENANSDLRGSVRLTPEGEVRWTTFSVFSGVERWRSENVQVGGVRSAKGVLGNWFDKDYDPRGPVGPTAFWKVSDKVTESTSYRALTHDFLPLIQGHFDEAPDEYDPEQSDDDEGDDDEPGLELEITGISWVTWTED